jgi:hypothetical protein
MSILLSRPSLCSCATAAVLGVAALALSGCVTRGYQLAPKNTPAPVALHLEAAQPPVEAAVHQVVVYQGPGSWKRAAYWDEYVVSVVNRGPAPLTIDSVVLHDQRGAPIDPGVNPWALERLSKKWWETNGARQTGTYLVLGAGTAVGAGVAVASAYSGLWGASVSAGTSAAGAIGAATAITLPLVAVGTVVANIHSKHRVEAEFTRRRLGLPLTLAPGQTVQGSLFFRITPGPQRLALHGRAADQPCAVTVSLAPLAGLHFAPPPATAPRLLALALATPTASLGQP